MPALLMAVFTILCSFGTLSNGIVLEIPLSLASIILWLRVLRILTLIPAIGPLILMVFYMITDVFKWIIILLIVVLAFFSGSRKLSDRNFSTLDDTTPCEPVTPFANFFEDTISGDSSCIQNKQSGSNKYFNAVLENGFFFCLEMFY